MHVQVAVWRALTAGLAFAGQADARAVLDPGGNRHGQAAFTLHRAGALANPARIADHPALTAAGRAGPLDQEEPRCPRTLPAPCRSGRSRAARPLSCDPVPSQPSHFTRVGTRKVTLVPLNASARSISTPCRRSAPVRVRCAAAPAHSEHLAEDIAEVAGGGKIEAAHAGATAAVALLERRMAEAIVGAALLVVLQHVVGFINFLESHLGLLVARVAIRMKLHCELAIRLFQVVRARIPRYTQRGVIILFGHLSPLLCGAPSQRPKIQRQR